MIGADHSTWGEPLRLVSPPQADRPRPPTGATFVTVAGLLPMVVIGVVIVLVLIRIG